MVCVQWFSVRHEKLHGWLNQQVLICASEPELLMNRWCIISAVRFWHNRRCDGSSTADSIWTLYRQTTWKYWCDCCSCLAGIKEGKIDLNGTEIRVAVAHGLGNAAKLMDMCVRILRGIIYWNHGCPVDVSAAAASVCRIKCNSSWREELTSEHQHL